MRKEADTWIRIRTTRTRIRTRITRTRTTIRTRTRTRITSKRTQIPEKRLRTHSEPLQPVEKSFSPGCGKFCNFKKLQKLIDLTRMTQVTLSCRFAAIHLETPLLGFFRNYLPSRIRTLFSFFDNLKRPRTHSEPLFFLLTIYDLLRCRLFACVFLLFPV